MKRFLLCLLSAVLILGLTACTSGETLPDNTESTPAESVGGDESTDTGENNGGEEEPKPQGEPTTLELNSNTKGIKILGERYIESDEQINCDWTCSGIEFVINSNGGSITFEAGSNKPCYFKAYVDGKEWKSTNGETYLKVDGETDISLSYISAGEHTVRLIKVTGHTLALAQLYSMTYYGTVSETAPAKNDMYIEFIGDSICCGYGVIGSDTNDGTYTAQDGSFAYPYLVARGLRADYSVTALSGQGIVSGGVCNMTKGYLLSSPLRDGEEKYGFERKADVVVINMGTNDYRNADKYNLDVESFRVAYEAMLKTIKEKNGDECKIVCLYNTMNDTFASSILAACANRGGEKAGIFSYQMTKAAKGHPNMAEHVNYFNALLPIVQNAYNTKVEVGNKDAALSTLPSGYGMSVDFANEAWTKESQT